MIQLRLFTIVLFPLGCLIRRILLPVGLIGYIFQLFVELNWWHFVSATGTFQVVVNLPKRAVDALGGKVLRSEAELVILGECSYKGGCWLCEGALWCSDLHLARYKGHVGTVVTTWDSSGSP